MKTLVAVAAGLALGWTIGRWWRWTRDPDPQDPADTFRW